MVCRIGGGTIGRISREYANVRRKIANENKISLVEADSIVAGVINEMNGKKKTKRFEIRF